MTPEQSQIANFAGIEIGLLIGIAVIMRNPGPPDFKQYVHAVVEHQRGSHDAGGKIIHATPPELRSEYARQIAGIKSRRRGEVPF